MHGEWTITGFCFFQAEDGIRDYKVTGVQTCALPICLRDHARRRGVRLPHRARVADRVLSHHLRAPDGAARLAHRSEERRVGEEGRSRRGREHGKVKVLMSGARGWWQLAEVQ